MPDITELIAYVQEARAVGLSDELIGSELTRVGWNANHIDQALGYAPVVPWPHDHAVASRAPQAIIRVNNLTKRYKNNFTAVDGISFEVMQGETFGILGPNGAGKTTTLEMIEGLKSITSGSVTLDGKDVASRTHEVKAVIGVQLQSSSFFESLTLKELLEVFASIYGVPSNAMELLSEVQLTDKASNQVKELSGGQKQRFSIAVGLVNQPKVLFLDEPTTGLDPQARRNLWELVGQIKKKGTTVVLTTHYMDEAEVLCDRIAVMDHAKIVALDTTRNLLRDVGISATVEFRSDHPVDVQVLQGLSGVQSVHVENGMYFLTTESPQQTLDGLFAAARNHRFAVQELMLKRATLEDVFLKLTGHQLRD